MLRLSAVCSFCPAGFDNGDDFEMDMGTAWEQWAVHEGLTETDMMNTLAAKTGATCDWYWGNDEGEDGYWDRLTGESGAAYWDCYAFEKSGLVVQHGEEAISNWPDDRWHQARLIIDKKCISSALCTIERSDKGWCSDFYREKVMPDCGPEDSYRTKYCTEICPLKEHEELCEEPPKAETLASPPSKCPVKRVGIFIKDKAQDIGKAALKVLRSFMPALLTPPEPSASAKSQVTFTGGKGPTLTSPILPASVSIR